jgi:hypothetical protein
MNTESIRKALNAQNLLTATAVLTEAFRAYPWLVLLSGLSIQGWTEPPVSFLSALIIIGAVAFVLGFSLSRGLQIAETRIATISLAVLLIVLLTRLENGGGYAFWNPAWFDYASRIPAQLGASLFFGFFLAWRGIAISRQDLSSDYLYRNFAIGIASFILLMLAWATLAGRQSNSILFREVAPYVLGYFFTALMGMGISNFLSLRRGLAGRSKATDLFSRRWLLVLLGVVASIVLIGSLVASSLSLNFVDVIIKPLNAVAGALLLALLYVVGYPLGYLVEGIGWLVGLIVNWIVSKLGTKPFESPEFSDFAENAGKIQSGQVPETLFNLIKWGILLIVIGLVVYFLSRAIFRYWRNTGEKGYEEIHESIWSWDGFRNDLRSFLNGLTDRFHRAQHATPPLASTIAAPQLLDIREVYKGLLWEGALCGHPRYHSQTPHEYESALFAVVPAQKRDVEDITEAYVRSRYGQSRLSDEESMALVNEWLSLRAAIRATHQGIDRRQP